jgi:glycosyltransferase involved in cell wall biosynthesis
VNIVLIGNYPPDRQQSMVRFAKCLEEGLNSRDIPARTVAPPARVAARRNTRGGLGKWLAYVDKFVLFPRQLRRLARSAPNDSVFHICDHSNAMYVRALPRARHLVTCHDLLAVRGAQGDPEAYCPASRTGRVLQRWILDGLASASRVVCVSRATQNDFRKLVPGYPGRLDHIPLGQNAAYRPLPPDKAWSRIAGLPLHREVPFILNVGSSLPRKNRDGCLRIFRGIADRFPGSLVFAGEALSPEHRALARELDLMDRVAELPDVTNERLEALYSVAHALLFPTRAEGFGWPVLEAQLCGCPVVCSDRTSVPEVAGSGAFIHALDDETGFGDSLLKLLDPAIRDDLRQRGFANASTLTIDRMIDRHLEVYREILQAA